MIVSFFGPRRWLTGIVLATALAGTSSAAATAQTTPAAPATAPVPATGTGSIAGIITDNAAHPAPAV